jgi:hypothetical protein
MPARSFDHARGNGESPLKIQLVPQVRSVLEQIVRATIDRFPCLGIEPPQCCASSHAGGDLTGLTTENVQQTLGNPSLQLRSGLDVKGQSG